MKFTTNQLVTALAVALLIPAASLAQNVKRDGYLLDGSGKFTMSATPGQCWHTGSWTPALAVEPCDPEIKKAVAAVVPAQPAPMAAAPVAAMPAPVAPVAAPMPQKMNFSADALFGFDKSILNTEGKKMLQDLTVQLKTVDTDLIHVTGHTDRLGSTAYNQKLSTQRATVVRDFLVEGGVAANRIDAKGMGESQPVTAAGDCKGKQSAKVIACLQPDRRVDVELQGTTKPRS
jgi:OOP family OmpA-OmpF porin